MAIRDLVATFVDETRRNLAANPRMAGEGTGRELLIAPLFHHLIQQVITDISPRGWRVLPEYQRAGIGRPDLALALPNSPARAFIELKEPRKSIEPTALVGHDLSQFERFQELPVWAITNFSTLKLYHRKVLVSEAIFLPSTVFDLGTTDAQSAVLVQQQDFSGFERILGMLAQAQAPSPANAQEAAQVLAHAARLVREIVLAQCREGLDPVSSNVRATFNETLFARAEAGGFDVRDMDQLFASAFAQTLVFGLLLAKEAAGSVAIDEQAYRHLPEDTYALLRGTLRALTLDEVRAMLGVGFDITLDAVNSVGADTMAVRDGRDPMLYLYEDFLRTFDPAAVAKYGVYYTPPEIVELIVAETERALRVGLRTEGLLDENVRLLDPACGTGTFMIGAADRAARQAAALYGEGMIGPVMAAFAQRMFGFELLVGPYTVAHYRMAREVRNRGGGVPHIPIYLTDTLAPPADERQIDTPLGFLGAPMVQERRDADAVKTGEPIIAIIGNPPYKRLKRGEIERLVGADMNRRWQDLKRPVQDAGFGRSMNAFPDLCIAFYRWALWRLFEAEGAGGRGVIAFITNRTFLTSAAYGGLRQMLRERFDTIRIIDLRGNNRGALPATVEADENVFKIEVGVCILIAAASGDGPLTPARVSYADVWQAGAFNRRQKLAMAQRASDNLAELTFVDIPGAGLDKFRPRGFAEYEWPSVRQIFLLRSNGIVTYRDHFVYAFSKKSVESRIQNWLKLDIAEAKKIFVDSDLNKAADALKIDYDKNAIEKISYRPFDERFVYNKKGYVDRQRSDLAGPWGQHNFGLMVLPGGTGAGPAAWSHGAKPDQHAFRGSYGGWIFPLYDAATGGDFVNPAVVAGMTAAYGGPVTGEQVFDAVLALLSATSYTIQFALDLEDDFPHVPFPARRSDFELAAAIGMRIRTLQGFRREPAAEFRMARAAGEPEGKQLDIPTPANAFRMTGEAHGEILLTADGSVALAGVSSRAWHFAVSGHRVIYKWLKARAGESMHGAEGFALLRGALEMIWRVEELLSLYDEADTVLVAALPLTLSREALQLSDPIRDMVEDDDEPA